MRFHLTPLVAASALLLACSQDWDSSSKKDDAGLDRDDAAVLRRDATVSDAPDSGTQNDDGAVAVEAATSDDGAVTQSSCPGACVASQPVACTTSCGSKGTGTCTDTCGVSAAAQCTAPQEVCNWVDDDCDGLADPGLLKQDTTASRVWTQPAGTGATHVALTPLTGGGAWWLYQNTLGTGAVRVVQLGSDGKTVQTSKTLTGTETSSRIRTDSTSKTTAVLSVDGSGASAVLNLRLYRTADMSFIDRYELSRANAACDFVAPNAVSLIEDADGAVHVAVAQAVVPGKTLTGGGCDFVQGPIELVIVSRNAAGEWQPLKRVGNLGTATSFSTDLTYLSRVPCRDDWLLAHSSSNGWVMRVLTKAGVERQAAFDSLPYGQAISGIAPTDCPASGDAEIPLVYVENINSSTAQPKGYLRTWKVARATGQVSRAGADVQLPLASAVTSFARSAGRTLMAAMDPTSVPHLFEVRNGSTFHEVQLSTLDDKLTNSSLATAGLVLGGGLRVMAMVDTGSKVVLAVSRNLPTTTLSAPTGDSNPPVAVTYALGCP